MNCRLIVLEIPISFEKLSPSLTRQASPLVTIEEPSWSQSSAPVKGFVPGFDE